MKYIICDRILFVPDLNTLSIIDNHEEVVTISNPARRLLELLITRQGQNVPREEIFQKVWDNFGMVSSNNNLNHCISKLRRVLRSFGIDEDVIVTIPKLGFTLHKEITVRIISEENVEHVALTPTSASSVEHVGQPRKRVGPVCWKMFSRQAILMLGGAFVLLLGLLIVRLYLYPRVQTETYLGAVESCKVYLHENGPEEKQPIMMQSIRWYLSKHPVSCASDEYLLVHRQYPGVDKRSDIMRLHITRCGLHRANQMAICSEL
ncbi:hypothetical protein GWD52_06035 [Enterobacteriaceae bacterium 4M9]|nr:hypothetical protein [Enterobacteriaceae bacterium 4M9]